MQAPEGDYTEQEVAEARETIEKYQTFIETHQDLNEFKLKSLEGKAVEAGRVRYLRENLEQSA